MDLSLERVGYPCRAQQLGLGQALRIPFGVVGLFWRGPNL